VDGRKTGRGSAAAKVQTVAQTFGWATNRMQAGRLRYLRTAQARKEQMYSQRPEETSMVKPESAGTSK
jgi:hypothetical protein